MFPMKTEKPEASFHHGVSLAHLSGSLKILPNMPRTLWCYLYSESHSHEDSTPQAASLGPFRSQLSHALHLPLQLVGH